MFKSGTIVVVTNFYSVKKLYVRINTPELTEFYNKIIVDIHQFYDSVKGKYIKLIVLFIKL